MPNHALIEIQLLLERQDDLRRATERARRAAPERAEERLPRASRRACVEPSLRPVTHGSA